LRLNQGERHGDDGGEDYGVVGVSGQVNLPKEMSQAPNHDTGHHQGVVYALLAAALFGASTPFAKSLLGQVAPVALAGMLYMGSGLGLLGFYLLRRLVRRDVNAEDAGLKRKDWPWLGGAILAGGVAGPVLLMIGLTTTPASSAALLLNMEGVLTSMLAWFVFKENFDRRIFIGMLLIVAAGVLLSWEQAAGLPLGGAGYRGRLPLLGHRQ
jgi:drug/metabolite transporter (DMT)-like permease